MQKKSGWSGQWWWNNKWNSGWDDAAWSSAGWQEGSWQDDCGDESRRDRGHDVDATPEQHPWAKKYAEEQEGAKGAEEEEEPPAPEDLAAEPTDRQPGAQPVPDDPDALRQLHEAALRRFLLDEETEPGSDHDGEALAGTQTQMLVDGDDIEAGIAEFDPATGGVTCKLCNMALNSKAQWEDHLKGKKHSKKVSAEERKRGANPQKLDTSNHLPSESYQ